jgi:hypothetical protein
VGLLDPNWQDSRLASAGYQVCRSCERLTNGREISPGLAVVPRSFTEVVLDVDEQESCVVRVDDFSDRSEHFLAPDRYHPDSLPFRAHVGRAPLKALALETLLVLALEPMV